VDQPAGQGKFGWEEVPYWLRGYIDLGYVLQDPAIIKRAGNWVNAVLRTQRTNGYFGSESNIASERVNGRRSRMLDIWPNMVMLFPLRSLHEATGDARILPFMTRYFRWQTTVPLEDFLAASWQKQRGGDNLDSILWLYNRTGDLARPRPRHSRAHQRLVRHGASEQRQFRRVLPRAAQFFQPPATRYVRATVRNYDDMIRLYGSGPRRMRLRRTPALASTPRNGPDSPGPR
jgi:hypothetical protein